MICPKPSPDRLKHRRYTPHTIDLCSWRDVAPLFDALLARRPDSAAALERLLEDIYDLAVALQEETARIQLALAVNTADDDAKQRFNRFNETVAMHSAKLFDRLNDAVLDDPHRHELDPERYGHLIRLMEHRRCMYREANVAPAIEDGQLAEHYNAVAGGMSVVFEGERQNLVQLGQVLKSPDRTRREHAWRAMAGCRIEHAGEIDGLYDKLVELRGRIAINADFSNFRDYQHQAYERFDYTSEDCYKYHDTIEKVAVPQVEECHRRRREKLGLERLRPWDMRVDPEGNEPLRPFTSQEDLVNGCALIFDRIYPGLGDTLRSLEKNGHLDLMTRHNKAPVGFNMPLSETRSTFIFMNGTGTHYDAMVLMHEGGHAIETLACANDPLLPYRHTPQEWGECASQAMELLALDHLDILYDDPRVRRRCILEKLEETLDSLVGAARMDAFQQWVYTTSGHTREQRNAYWLDLGRRFDPSLDIEGLEPNARISWQAVPHLFLVPFYYIEYGIAQLAALQVYRNVRQEGRPAVERWLRAMRLGYSRSIPELYEATGLRFQFHGAYAEELIRFVGSEIDRMEAQ
ncbi:M3 family oligoendopeptidase [bacterium]|nr:M3 family oligoendopeptidase [candidate division CSSED10-310 bacterium]